MTRDALIEGAPVIGPVGAWISRQISEQSSGDALQGAGAESMLGATQTLMASYDRYRKNALAAARELSARNWAPLLSLLC